MESLLSSYGLPFAGFQELLQNTNSLVAGSAALALYLQQEGIDPGFVPNDLDIWAEDTRQLVAARGAYVQHGNYYRFSNFLIKNGYNLVAKNEPKESYESLQSVTHILSFLHPNGKKIQVILLKETDLSDYITDHFDLSICMTWWNAKENKCETIYPKETLAKEMYYYPSSKDNARESERIAKYVARGFRRSENPCPCVGHRDERANVMSLAGQTAFDLFAYEDVDCAEFLKASSWHVLLRIGENFHAFHRKTLNCYLRSHKHNYGYDTPYKQNIPWSAVVWLNWSDYSIVELLPTASGLSACRFYTTEQWAGGIVGRTCIKGLVPDIPLQ